MLAGQPPEMFAYWTDVVGRIRIGDQTGLEDLYAALSDGAYPRISRGVDPQSIDDRLHEVLLIVTETIRSGGLRDPRRLMGFVRTVTRRRIAHHVRSAMLQRRYFVALGGIEHRAASDQTPEALSVRRQRVDGVMRALDGLKPRDREIVVRFYLHEQPPAQICLEMQLTETQFRLYKSRAIAKCLRLTQSAKPFSIA